METDLRAYLLADATIAGLVGDRLQWNRRAQRDVLFPQVALTRVAGRRGAHMGGPDGLSESIVQLDIYGLTVASVKTVADAVSSRLHGARFTQGNTEFQGVFQTGENMSYEEDSSASRLERIRLDFAVWHTE